MGVKSLNLMWFVFLVSFFLLKWHKHLNISLRKKNSLPNYQSLVKSWPLRAGS